ncbi:PglZ domain-containing protein [Solibacillus isronensis]|uniref:PglZ domain-containing protein n=1 Tax=Solibacillus isronensis TaxID=412383 RepID=UPI0039A28308
MVNEIYLHHLAKYIESIKENDLDHPMLFLRDNNNLFHNIEGVNVSNLYPHDIYFIENHHEFRKHYEHYKNQEIINKPIIFIVNKAELENKIQDFVMRSYGRVVHGIDLKKFLNQVIQGLNWHEKINEYSAAYVQKYFEGLLQYRKSIPKSNISKKETDLIVLSAIYDIDATKINGIVDCYLYYREILDVYSISVIDGMNNDFEGLMLNVFKSNGGEVLSLIIQKNLFRSFERTMWVSHVLRQFDQLTEDNVKNILGNEYLPFGVVDYSELSILAERVERKNKKLYLEKRDQAEMLVRSRNITLYKETEDYVSFIKENSNSTIHVIEGIKKVLQEFNLEGLKRLYKYTYEDLKKIVRIVEESQYRTQSLTKTKEFVRVVYNWLNRVQFLEKDIQESITVKKTFSEWMSLFTEQLYDLEFELSNIRYELDKESFIEPKRYEGLEKRLNRVLNVYRKDFAKFVEKNYDNWLKHPTEQPLLNNRISTKIPIRTEKIILIIFDGMRYDAWKKVVEPYFSNLLNERETIVRNSIAMLPSITSLSREAIYKDIKRNYGYEVNYITKSESEVKKQQVSDSLLMTKRINILIYNMFDKEGHSSSQGLSVFYKRQKEVFEASIKSLIRSLPEDVEIVITSDHGLMKNNHYEKIDFAEEVKPRYVLASEDVLDSIQIDNYKLSYSDKGYYSGGGEKDLYSHGGASLEEIVLPFIHIRPKKATYETIHIKEAKPHYQIFLNNKSVTIDVVLNNKEKVILDALAKHQLTTKDIQTLLIKKFGDAGMIDGMVRRLNKKLFSKTELKIDISSAGEIIIYKLVMR